MQKNVKTTGLRVLAIVPAYNEEESIETAVADLEKNAPFVDVLIVNDGSTDNTAGVCKRNGWNCVSLPINLGLSNAFQTGMKYALLNNYDFAIQFDGDGQHRAEHIKTLLNESRRSTSDIVIGSRFITEKKGVSARMFGSVILSTLMKLTTGKKITDPTSGMRLYNKKAIEQLAEKYDYGPEPDTLALLIRKGFSVQEVQVSMNERQAGESYFSLHRSMAYMMRMVVSIILVQWVRK